MGDWVKIIHHHTPKPLIKVKKVDLEDFRDALLQVYPEITYEPIPITPEILEKNGFKCINNVYPYPTFRIDDTENCFALTIAFPKGNKTKRKHPFIEIDTKDVLVECIIINFVHELQHALKLCKIEKDIVL